MKTLAFAFALLVMFMVTGQTQVIKQNGGNPSTVRYSTFTVVGDGSKCFSVDDPTLVVDCNLNRVGIGTASPATTLDVNGNAQFGSGATKSTVTTAGSLIMAAGAIIANGTADASDSGVLKLAGGGAVDPARGATIQLMGNENGDAGHIYYDVGNIAGSRHVFRNGAGASVGIFQTNGAFLMYVRTKAQIDALTPAAAGDQVICSDCTVPFDICIATGTNISGFRATINSAISTTIPGTLVSKGCGTNN